MKIDPIRIIDGDITSTITLQDYMRRDRLFTHPDAAFGIDWHDEHCRYNTLAYIALSERMLRHVINSATHGGAKNKVTVPAVTFGEDGQKRGQSEAYQEAYRVGAESVVCDMLYDMTQMHFGILGTSYLLSPLYIFKAIIGLTKDQHESLDYELNRAWTLDVGVVYRSIHDARRIPLGVLGIQVGLASLMLRDDFECEEDQEVVQKLLQRFSLITRQQAEMMLDGWRESTKELLRFHTMGQYV